jgi:hypothetical protein
MNPAALSRAASLSLVAIALAARDSSPPLVIDAALQDVSTDSPTAADTPTATNTPDDDAAGRRGRDARGRRRDDARPGGVHLHRRVHGAVPRGIARLHRRDDPDGDALRADLHHHPGVSDGPARHGLHLPRGDLRALRRSAAIAAIAAGVPSATRMMDTPIDVLLLGADPTGLTLEIHAPHGRRGGVPREGPEAPRRDARAHRLRRARYGLPLPVLRAAARHRGRARVAFGAETECAYLLRPKDLSVGYRCQPGGT